MNKYIKFPFLLIFFSLPLVTNPLAAQSQQNPLWPKVIPLEGFSITIYRPEIEDFSGNSLNARSAFSVYDGKNLPVFGAIWFRSQVHIDHAKNTVLYDNIQMVDVNFPDATTAKKNELRALLDAVTPTWQFNSDLSGLAAAVEVISVDNESSFSLNNNPPNVFYENQNTELVFIDGEPILENVDGSELYKYIVNTPKFIVKSTSDEFYYLQAEQWWFRTKDIYGTWDEIGSPPLGIETLLKRSKEYTQLDNKELTNNTSTKPNLIVVTHPAVLIQIDGEPELTVIPDTELLYVTNTGNDLLFNNKTAEYLVRFSGRWYKSMTLRRGDWRFVAPDSLPNDFRKIPQGSDIGRVRLSVPGTPESMSATLDNAIPQTAVVDRKTATIRVEYDGDPVFEPIEGTSLQYALNTNLSVIKTKSGQYYAVDEAIWFTSDSSSSNKAADNWSVATEIPAEVQLIPPSCTVFNIKYVYIYDFSDDYVYVGYSGGYTGTFVYQGCLFYGTGYRYKPWYKSKYVPRPQTFAFGVVRKPSKSNVRVTVSVGYGYGYGGYGGGYGGYGRGFGYPGFYSPYGYYGGYGVGYGSYSTAVISGNYEIKTGTEEKPLDPVNIYNNRNQGIVGTTKVRRNDPFEILPENQQGKDGGWAPPANLYSDGSGEVYKKDDEGTWFKRSDGVWVKTVGKPFN